jgi:hypothetical protein
MSNDSNFTTERIPVAVYLHASKLLNFVRCERTADNRVRFVFDDPEHQGDCLEHEFDEGVMIEAKSIAPAQKFLREHVFTMLAQKQASPLS